MNVTANPQCSCWRCTDEWCKANPPAPDQAMFGGAVDVRLSRMFLCATCGNKRCPHATDHRLECSGSNEPGQKGSNYE